MYLLRVRACTTHAQKPIDICILCVVIFVIVPDAIVDRFGTGIVPTSNCRSHSFFGKVMRTKQQRKIAVIIVPITEHPSHALSVIVSVY